jgi:hypothetical protein
MEGLAHLLPKGRVPLTPAIPHTPRPRHSAEAELGHRIRCILNLSNGDTPAANPGLQQHLTR